MKQPVGFDKLLYYLFLRIQKSYECLRPDRIPVIHSYWLNLRLENESWGTPINYLIIQCVLNLWRHLFGKGGSLTGPKCLSTTSDQSLIKHKLLRPNMSYSQEQPLQSQTLIITNNNLITTTTQQRQVAAYCREDRVYRISPGSSLKRTAIADHQEGVKIRKHCYDMVYNQETCKAMGTCSSYTGNKTSQQKLSLRELICYT